MDVEGLRAERLIRARTGKRESKTLEFKGQFDPNDTRETVELVKDLAAIANSGGGIIVIGLKTNGTPTGVDLSRVLDLDSADLTNAVLKYTDVHFAGFDIQAIKRRRRRFAAIIVDSVLDVPLVFVRPGTFPVENNRQQTAFSQGTIYFRHGAKSEPASRADLSEFIERRLEAVRTSWMSGIRRVVAAPDGAEVALIQRTEGDGDRTSTIRLTTDPGAPVYGKVDHDDTHPFRQTELIEEVNKRLPRRARKINSHDIQCVRRVHDIQPQRAPEFVHQAKHALAPQYSLDFVQWLVQRRRRDHAFFKKARAETSPAGSRFPSPRAKSSRSSP